MSLDLISTFINALDGYAIVFAMMGAVTIGFLGTSIRDNGFAFWKGKENKI